MASPIVSKMREEATCAICLLLMAEPVSISCGHSYCRQCITGFLENIRQEIPSQPLFYCPHCRAPFQVTSLRPNKQLGSLIEVIKEMGQDMSCEEHGEFLHIFCEDEGQLICWRCERSPQHQGHNTAVIEDVCQGYQVSGWTGGLWPVPLPGPAVLRPVPSEGDPDIQLSSSHPSGPVFHDRTNSLLWVLPESSPDCPS